MTSALSMIRHLPTGMLILLQRGFQALAGLITMVVISRFLTPEEQGWYYTVLSLGALYTLLDLGLSVLMVPLFAKHFNKVSLLPGGGLEGEGGMAPAWLLGRAVRWYGGLATAFLALALPGGAVYFSHASITTHSWGWAWVVAVISACGILLLMPFLAFIEAAGKVRALASLRLLQVLFGACACWLMLVRGQEMWAAVMMPAMSVLVPFLGVLSRWPKLLTLVWRNPGLQVDWRREILPLQWRQGVIWACAYLTTQIYTPILMHTQGAVVAGQMGLSLAIMTMVGFLGQSLLSRRIPMMAQAAARRDLAQLDAMFRRDSLFFFASFICAGLVLLALKLALSGTAYGARVLPFWELVGLLGMVFISQLVGVLGTYLRSFLYEPLTKVNLVATLVAVPSAVVAAHFSSAAVISVLLAVSLLINFPWACSIWWRERRRWQSLNDDFHA